MVQVETALKRLEELERFHTTMPKPVREGIIKDVKTTLEDMQELMQMSAKLLRLADQLTEPPHYILQPGLSIVRDHVDLINRYGLTEEAILNNNLKLAQEASDNQKES